MGDALKIVFAQSVITVFALLLAYVKLKQEIRKSRQERVYEARLERLKRQLSDFYGPLYMLATSTTELAKKLWGTDMWEEVWKEIIVPSHQQIENILLAKIDLLEETEIPESYFDFLKHCNVNRTYLKGGAGLSYFEKNVPYPPQFDLDVASGYRKKREEYLQLLRSTD